MFSLDIAYHGTNCFKKWIWKVRGYPESRKEKFELFRAYSRIYSYLVAECYNVYSRLQVFVWVQSKLNQLCPSYERKGSSGPISDKPVVFPFLSFCDISSLQNTVLGHFLQTMVLRKTHSLWNITNSLDIIWKYRLGGLKIQKWLRYPIS